MMSENPKPHYQRIAAALLSDFPGAMQWLGLSGGKRQNDEWLAINPTRSDSKTGSFSINSKSGRWSDFATGDAGGDLVALAAYLHGVPMHESADSCAAHLGIPGLPKNDAQKRATRGERQPGKGKGIARNGKAAPSAATSRRR